MKKLYFFDFDGTLTKHDTMFMFLKHCDKFRFAKQFVLHLPLFSLLKLKLAKAENVKRHFIASILKGHTKSFLEEKAQSFFEENYPSLIRENALEFIKNINRDLSESYIVSASLDIWVKPFADKFNMKLIATEALFKDGIFMGKFKGANCNGKEKVRRIREEIKDKKFDKSIAFGDTEGDRAMLDFVNEGHYEFFH
ncbi:HAD-superfamily subfamily IB hydrolase, TIGR01490 [Halpernia humi]|uniref:HAD-superfamily subfamily IB hydrolase, TIGR01490 n=1 Tax=Halpernia humi TaxID=493375 RepID=A0A1H5ZMM7_9FLAO|nr:HAD-IB family hydrolase [Halpernia humi]SEG36636.1 HAD-superfamily subfamily IB hydrolase, TIGR01490 [Halpernia humi]